MDRRLPGWLKRRFPASGTVDGTAQLLRSLGLHTVCESACCPNIGECFAKRTATFMILGDSCTRDCGFCAVRHGKPSPPDEGEPGRVAEAAKRLGLRHVVVTSVTRDDLADGGALVFAATVASLRSLGLGMTVEVLTPDFGGLASSIDTVAGTRPEVYNHNVETVRRLYSAVRPQADYSRSLGLLERVKQTGSGVVTKSGFMVGLGESRNEVLEVMGDLRSVGCDMVTIGQYLKPAGCTLEVTEFVRPDVFSEYKREGEKMGFAAVAAGPFVRSSYQAGRLLRRLQSCSHNQTA